MLNRTLKPLTLSLTLVAIAASAAFADPDREGVNDVTLIPALTEVTDAAVDLPWMPTQQRLGALAVNRAVLDALATKETNAATLALFEDVALTVRPNRIEYRGEDSYSIGASVDGVIGGTMVLVREGENVLGNIWAGEAGTFEIRTTPGGVAVQELNMTKFPGCDTPDEPAAAAPIEMADAPTEGVFCVDDGSETKLLILFTPASVAGIGGSSQMLGFAQLCVSTTNQTYFNSGIVTGAVLSGFAMVEYNESGDGFTDRDRLTNPNDGFMDDAHALRDQVGADVVSMIVNNIGACGVANFSVVFPNTGIQSLAFNVVRRDCAVGNLSFPHELGHNQGSRHDRAADGSNGAFDYSHGFIAPNGAFRTVMGTSNLFAPRIPFFSNPDVNFSGQPTGVAPGLSTSAHNTLSINNSRIIVANFRTDDCVIPGDLNGDGVINGTDIAILLSVWGSPGTGTGADINGDGTVNGSDLAFLLSNWTVN